MKSRMTIGIIGGMGPAATCLLFDLIVRNTPAKSDQEHLHIIVNNDPSIPDRTAAIMGIGPSPIAATLRSIRLLEKAGADLLVMPCMTSHHFLSELRSGLSIPLLDAVGEIAKYIKLSGYENQRVGVFATDGSRFGKVYEPLRKCCDLVYPCAEDQALFMDAVYGAYGIKTIGPNGDAASKMQELVLRMSDQGASTVISGCTEMSVGLAGVQVAVPLIDPLQLLAKAAVHMAVGNSVV